MLKLDIFSDPICPWCYIGKARLDAALESRPDHAFVIEWHPFMLEPGMPAEGREYAAHMESVFGSPKKVVEAMLPAQQAAEELGLALDFGAIRRIPSTLNAHRLIHWAAQEGRQSPVVAALFRAHFAEGRDIGDPATLLEIAGAAGLARDVMAPLLASDADIDEIRTRDAEIRARGLRGVPAFILGGQHVIAGAQPTSFWQQLIDDLKEQR